MQGELWPERRMQRYPELAWEGSSGARVWVSYESEVGLLKDL